MAGHGKKGAGKWGEVKGGDSYIHLSRSHLSEAALISLRADPRDPPPPRSAHGNLHSLTLGLARRP